MAASCLATGNRMKGTVMSPTIRVRGLKVLFLAVALCVVGCGDGPKKVREATPEERKKFDDEMRAKSKK